MRKKDWTAIIETPNRKSLKAIIKGMIAHYPEVCPPFACFRKKNCDAMYLSLATHVKNKRIERKFKYLKDLPKKSMAIPGKPGWYFIKYTDEDKE